jgi:signal transduction histidine kinase
MPTWVDGRLVPARAAAAVLAVALAVAVAASVPATLLLERTGAALGHPELRQAAGEIVFGAVVIISAGGVGLALTLRRPHHPVGWCFLGLAAATGLPSLAWSYATYALIARPGGELPLAVQAAILGDNDWLLWFGLITAILHLTPTGRPVSRLWGATLAVTTTVIVLGLLLKLLLDPVDLRAPLAGISTNPWAWDAAAGVLRPIGTILVWCAGLGPILGAWSLLARFRRAQGDERQQLKWLALAAFPVPLLIVVSYAASVTDQSVLVTAATAGYLIVIPVCVWLSISRFRLYDVDRVLSRAATWALLSIALIAIYLGVVLLATTALRGATNGSELAAGLAGVCAAALATPLHRRAQQAVDRRFNRRRYETLRMIRRFVVQAPSGPGVEDVLRTALGDPGLAVAYVVHEAGGEIQWVDIGGHPAPILTGSQAQAQAQAQVWRGERLVARVSFDPSLVDQSLVSAAADLVSGELENVALRSAVARQLEQVLESRSRIVQAQLDERTRIERNLHDGAQQQLLAVAFDLSTARLQLGHLQGTDEVQAQLAASVQALQDAVAELRNLANGLLPSALSSSGLRGALLELAGRTPVPLTIQNTTGTERFADSVEATVWFTALESVTNAVKHARPSTIDVALARRDGQLVIEIGDDGIGGANLGGRGLRGLADRVEAIGGTFAVLSRSPSGTLVRAELPCES